MRRSVTVMLAVASITVGMSLTGIPASVGAVHTVEASPRTVTQAEFIKQAEAEADRFAGLFGTGRYAVEVAQVRSDDRRGDTVRRQTINPDGSRLTVSEGYEENMRSKELCVTTETVGSRDCYLVTKDGKWVYKGPLHVWDRATTDYVTDVLTREINEGVESLEYYAAQPESPPVKYTVATGAGGVKTFTAYLPSRPSNMMPGQTDPAEQYTFTFAKDTVTKKLSYPEKGKVLSGFSDTDSFKAVPVARLTAPTGSQIDIPASIHAGMNSIHQMLIVDLDTADPELGDLQNVLAIIYPGLTYKVCSAVTGLKDGYLIMGSSTNGRTYYTLRDDGTRTKKPRTSPTGTFPACSTFRNTNPDGGTSPMKNGPGVVPRKAPGL